MSLISRIEAGEILITDGGTGTYLQEHGLNPGASPELFNISNPEKVINLAEKYYRAGSDIVLTNSFGGSKFMLSKYGAGDRVFELNRKAAELACSVRPSDKYVLGSIGPIGELVQPVGQVSKDELFTAISQQVNGLVMGGVDGILLETQFDLNETITAVKASKSQTDLPIFATMVFDKGPRGYFTMMGTQPKEAVERLMETGIDVVGANCGNGIWGMVEIAKEMRSAGAENLIIQSNAGVPAIRNRSIEYPEKADYMVKGFEVLSNGIANIIGGCCGTSPKHIAELYRLLGPVNERRTHNRV